MKCNAASLGAVIGSILMLGSLLTGVVAASDTGRDIDAGRLAKPDARDWLTVGRTYGEQNYSPLDQINERSVSRLGMAWSYDLHADRGVEAAPLEADGVLYDIQPWNITTALDARTGRVLWKFDPHVPPAFARKACCDIDSRGIALWHGKLILATLDGRLIGLNAKTGAPIWSVQTFDRSKLYTITGAPRVFDGKVVIGNAGSDQGTRGYVTAYDADTGRLIWRFHTVPGDPAKGSSDPALLRAARTWRNQYWKFGGGGNVWDALAFDPKLNLIYIGTGNAFPFLPAKQASDRLYTACIVAVDARTGRYVWHYQETPEDQWDYDATTPMILADLSLGGRSTPVIMQASKNGFFYVLDRADGHLISATPFVPVTWATGIDARSGRPIVNPKAQIGSVPTMVSPGPGGAHSYNALSFSPRTGLVYFTVSQTFFGYTASPDIEGEAARPTIDQYAELRKQISDYAEAHLKNWLTAWDPVAKKEAWRVPYPLNGSGGTLATAGNLVFEGTIGQTLAAYRATDGAKLWEAPIQNIAIGSPITYELDGEQYLAVNAGWGGGTARLEGFRFANLHLGPSRLLVFKLGANGKLPPLPVQASMGWEKPPASTASPEAIARGALLYAKNCSLCHGAEARGGVKDLRRMSGSTHQQFFDIVLGGARKTKGMASFADVLSHDDAAAIHAYLIKRANDDWSGENGARIQTGNPP